jgi:hypothetical protein
MARSILKYRLQHAAGEGGDDGAGGEHRPSPAEINAEQNRRRLDRMAEIGRTADARRAQELRDVDGERVTGEFAGGEFEDDPKAKERQAELEAQAAEDALEEQRRRAEEEEGEQAEARRLQAEGAGADPGAQPTPADEDEKVVDGVRYYRTMVAGQERWLTLKQLRESAAASANAEETLRRAQDALRSAAQVEPTPKAAPAEELSDQDLENIVLSASTGDEEAVRKLVSVIKARPAGPDPQAISRQVTQQIATQREVERSEKAVEDVLGNQVLAPEFRRRLGAYAKEHPTERIYDAYSKVGDSMRKDFAAMLTPRPGQQQPASKAERKRTIVNPPQAAGRQPPPQDDDREVPVSEQIDAIARSRGQGRAYRSRRS